MARFNFPSRLPRNNRFAEGLSYPLNLLSGSPTSGRRFYTNISFKTFEVNFDESFLTETGNEGLLADILDFRNVISNFLNRGTQTIRNSITSYRTDSTNIILPIPRKLNETHLLSWQDKSFTDYISLLGQTNDGNRGNPITRGLDLAGATAAGAVNLARNSSVLTGVSVNPFVFVYFDRPQFKRYSLTWTLAARNKEESDAIRDIVLKLKERSSPTIDGFLMGYPDIVEISFAPDDIFGMLKMKQCVIEAVGVDYTPSGPSFFDSNAPTLVNLTLNLKEIELWEQSDYYRDGVEWEKSISVIFLE